MIHRICASILAISIIEICCCCCCLAWIPSTVHHLQPGRRRGRHQHQHQHQQISSTHDDMRLAFQPSRQQQRHQRQRQQQQSKQCLFDGSLSLSASTMGGGDYGVGWGNLHGQNACFLPLNQLDETYYAPRIIPIAGSYPGLTRMDFFAVTADPPAEMGQWMYDFSCTTTTTTSAPGGSQPLGTVALDGSNLVASCVDPVVVIAEHFSLGVELPKTIQDPVDLLVLVDRAKTGFAERKFLLFTSTANRDDDLISIAAFNSKSEVPDNIEILGQVEMVQIPWLPSMAKVKTGFMEADEYF